MLLELALVTAIHKSNPHLTSPMVQRLAHVLTQESRERSLDPWMFFAIVQQESGWTPTAMHRYRSHRWCDAGLAQVHVRCTRRLVLPLLNPETNLRRAAQIQQTAMTYCRQNACEKSWVFLYNHSSQYVLQVNQVAQEARDEYAAPQVRPSGTPTS